MVQLLGMLLAVAAILFLSWYLTKKLGTMAGYRSAGSQNLKVLERVALGQNEALAIVRAGGDYLLLGITPAGITCLKQLEEDELDMDSPEGTFPRNPEDFHSLLEQLKKRKQKYGK